MRLRIRGVMIWVALTMAVWALIETWLGNSIGEMQNFLLGSLVLILASKEFE